MWIEPSAPRKRTWKPLPLFDRPTCILAEELGDFFDVGKLAFAGQEGLPEKVEA